MESGTAKVEQQINKLTMIDVALRDEMFATLTFEEKKIIADDVLANFDEIEKHRNKKVIFLLGTVGTGRSTLLNLLLGHHFKESGVHSLKKTLTPIQSELSKNHPIAPVGNSIAIVTKSIKLYDDPFDKDVHYSDCVGFMRFECHSSTHSKLKSISHLIAVRLAMQLARQVTFLLAESHTYFTTVRPHNYWDEFYNPYYNIGLIIKNIETVKPSSLIMVITHVDLNQDDNPKKSDYQSAIQERYGHYLEIDDADSCSTQSSIYRMMSKTLHLVLIDYKKLTETKHKLGSAIALSLPINNSNLYLPNANNNVSLLAKFTIGNTVQSQACPVEIQKPKNDKMALRKSI